MVGEKASLDTAELAGSSAPSPSRLSPVLLADSQPFYSISPSSLQTNTPVVQVLVDFIDFIVSKDCADTDDASIPPQVLVLRIKASCGSKASSVLSRLH